MYYTFVVHFFKFQSALELHKFTALFLVNCSCLAYTFGRPLLWISHKVRTAFLTRQSGRPHQLREVQARFRSSVLLIGRLPHVRVLYFASVRIYAGSPSHGTYSSCRWISYVGRWSCFQTTENNMRSIHSMMTVISSKIHVSGLGHDMSECNSWIGQTLQRLYFIYFHLHIQFSSW